MSAVEEYDVVVVGLGPTGLTAAALLGQLKHRVAVIEKHPALYGLPRAGHVDHEIVRTLQDLGVEGPFLEDAFPIEDYHWYNADRQVLLSFNWGGISVSGFNSDYMMYQPVMEDAIVSAIRRESRYVSMLQGYEVLRVSQDDKVSLEITRCVSDGPESLKRVGEPKTLRARYVIAADGARSGIREACAIRRDRQDFNATWLDVDVFVKRPLPKMNPHQVCDPRRPAFISPLGKRHHRFEWCVLPGESVEDFAKPEKAWALLAGLGITTEDVEIRRQQVYGFEAKVAESWRAGRILLAGDAAHTMPPFMGQGACSGMRDSVNLAWKLDLILRGISSESILDSYQIEREPHTRTWIDLSILSGEVSCTLDAEQAAQRDAALLSGTAPPMPAFPHLTAGVLFKAPQGAPIAPAGELFLQREVAIGERRGLFDDVVGRGFLLIGVHGDPRVGLSEADTQFLSSIGTTAAWIANAGQSMASAFDDLTGEYAQLFERTGTVAFLIRPDHYIFGAARSKGELSEMIGQLKSSLHITP
ncbi:MAG: bifunctional 3-(3-hydroxy-phenyl)propionate/3-hydroxycinnamic acid hydroxylase [Pirellulaceae bacterium]